MNQKGFAVITGFARELAGRHHNLVLAAHPIEPLGAFASALRQSNNQYFGNFRERSRSSNIRCLLPLERTHLDKVVDVGKEEIP
jgi:hypothetical protein